MIITWVARWPHTLCSSCLWPVSGHILAIVFLFVCTSARPNEQFKPASYCHILLAAFRPSWSNWVISWFDFGLWGFGADPRNKTKLKKNLKLINFSVWHKYFKFICLVWWKSLKCLAIIKANYEKYEYHQSATVCWGSRRRTDRQRVPPFGATALSGVPVKRYFEPVVQLELQFATATGGTRGWPGTHCISMAMHLKIVISPFVQGGTEQAGKRQADNCKLATTTNYNNNNSNNNTNASKWQSKLIYNQRQRSAQRVAMKSRVELGLVPFNSFVRSRWLLFPWHWSPSTPPHLLGYGRGKAISSAKSIEVITKWRHELINLVVVVVVVVDGFGPRFGRLNELVAWILLLLLLPLVWRTAIGLHRYGRRHRAQFTVSLN